MQSWHCKKHFSGRYWCYCPWWAGIGGLAGSRVEIYDDKWGNITGYITLPSTVPCHVSLGGYHTVVVYLLLWWHFSAEASQNTKSWVSDDTSSIKWPLICEFELAQPNQIWGDFNELKGKTVVDNLWSMVNGQWQLVIDDMEPLATGFVYIYLVTGERMGRGRSRRGNRHPLELVMGGKWKPGLRGKRCHLMGTRWNIEILGTRSDIGILEFWGQDGTLMTFEGSVLP